MAKKQAVRSALKPTLFVGSNVESLHVADAVKDGLADDAEVTVWTADVFGLSDDALGSLERVLEAADCALFIANGHARDRPASPNFDLLVDLGVSVGHLGAERTAVLLKGRSALKLPSNLRNLSVFRIGGHGTGERALVAALRRWIRTIGRRRQSQERARPSERLPKASKDASPRRQPAATTRSGRSVRDSVFISYSHADAKWLTRIRIMLTPLVRADRMSVWDDTKIKPGTRWRKEIERAIESAKVALLLVSPSFLASPFIAERELPPLLNAARNEGLAIIWALISACLYQKTPLSEYQAAHHLAKPLDALPAPKRNQALLAIAETVEAALESVPGAPKRNRSSTDR